MSMPCSYNSSETEYKRNDTKTTIDQCNANSNWWELLFCFHYHCNWICVLQLLLSVSVLYFVYSIVHVGFNHFMYVYACANAWACNYLLLLLLPSSSSSSLFVVHVCHTPHPSSFAQTYPLHRSFLWDVHKISLQCNKKRPNKRRKKMKVACMMHRFQFSSSFLFLFNDFIFRHTQKTTFDDLFLVFSIFHYFSNRSDFMYSTERISRMRMEKKFQKPKESNQKLSIFKQIFILPFRNKQNWNAFHDFYRDTYIHIERETHVYIYISKYEMVYIEQFDRNWWDFNSRCYVAFVWKRHEKLFAKFIRIDNCWKLHIHAYI